MKLILDVDADDDRDIHAAVAHYQKTVRWSPGEGGGVMLGEGTSDLLGAIVGEICRDWLDYKLRTAAERREDGT